MRQRTMATTRPRNGATSPHVQIYANKPLPPIPQSPSVAASTSSPSHAELMGSFPTPQSCSSLQQQQQQKKKKSSHSRSRSLPSNNPAPTWQGSRQIPAQPSAPRLVIPAPSATGLRPSRKVQQLTGHDVDVMVQKAAPYNMIDEDLTDDMDLGLDEQFFEPSSYGRTSPGEGLMPVLEVDEGSSSGRSSWASGPPYSSSVPAPLNIMRHGRNLSNDSGIGGFSAEDGYGSEVKRWDPAYGQFTDMMAAGEYHRFASELASALPSTSPTTSTRSESPLEEKRSSKLRFSGSAALVRFYDLPATAKRSLTPSPKVTEEVPVETFCVELDSTPIDPPPKSAFDCDSDDEGEDLAPVRSKHWWNRSSEEGNRALRAAKSMTFRR